MEHEHLVIKDGAIKRIRQDVDKASIKEIKIPEGVTEIDDLAFSDCSSLESMEIPEGVTRIGWLAFADCGSLASLYIPASVKSIELLAFDGCHGLARVRYGGTLAQWCAMDGGGWFARLAKSVTLTGENGLDLKKLTTLKIPECVTEIGAWAFEGCERLESAEIPASVTSIGPRAFDGCESLLSAAYGGTLAQWCAMSGGGHLASVAKSVTLTGENGLDFNALAALKIPEGVAEIGYNAFCGCKNLESVEIPEGVARINGFAFENCEGLRSVDIPASVTGIGFGAFHKCENIEGVAYAGTRKQWKKVQTERGTLEGLTVRCADGDITAK